MIESKMFFIHEKCFVVFSYSLIHITLMMEVVAVDDDPEVDDKMRMGAGLVVEVGSILDFPVSLR
jgi:hypothetical protein